MKTFTTDQVSSRFYVGGFEFGSVGDVSLPGSVDVVRIGVNEWMEESVFNANEAEYSERAYAANGAEDK